LGGPSHLACESCPTTSAAIVAVLAITVAAIAEKRVDTPCLVGFAWRAWLVLYVLPAWLVAMRRESIAP